MAQPHTCPLCKQMAEVFPPLQDNSEIFKCKCCGRFRVAWLVDRYLAEIAELSSISGYTRQYSQADDPVLLTKTKVDEILASAPASIWDKSKQLLRQFDKRSRHFGDVVTFDLDNDYPLAFAKNREEFRALLNLLDDSGFIKCCSPTQFVLNAEGIRELESLRRSNAQSEKVFVAMSFAADLRPMYDNCIEPTVRNAGYRPIRIDLEEHNEDIVARVLMEIREARFVIADFTGHRNGVYFEAGFAKGLGLEVIWLCRSDDIGKAHFDTQHFNHVVWNSEDELSGKLLSRIVATVGPGPLKHESLPS